MEDFVFIRPAVVSPHSYLAPYLEKSLLCSRLIPEILYCNFFSFLPTTFVTNKCKILTILLQQKLGFNNHKKLLKQNFLSPS